MKMLGLTIAAALLVFSGCAKPVSTTSTTTSAPVITTSTASTTSAAAKPSTTVVTTAAPKPATPTGPYGELRIAIASFSGAVLDPTQGSISNNWNLLSPIFDWFLRVKPGGELGPGVVEKWELSGNALTFHFRKGIKFSNGDDLTAEDGKASIERQAAMNRFYVAEIKGWLSSMEVPDPYTLVIR
ncbi:MAG: hypothetical protein HYY32_03885, partial [Chloroflexi bacterium]|nr:hypothetical protein [Chloroflexota bacterium]